MAAKLATPFRPEATKLATPFRPEAAESVLLFYATFAHLNFYFAANWSQYRACNGGGF